MDSLADQFFVLRHKHRFTVLELSKRAGVHRNTITRVEAGKFDSANVSTLQAIANALDCEVELSLKPKVAN